MSRLLPSHLRQTRRRAARSWWELADPADAQSIEAVQKIRNEIRARVERLLNELGVPLQGTFPLDAQVGVGVTFTL